MTFDLALNKLASMLALVEAVKFYEAAGEEYEAVDGNQQTHAERLHFIEMRREALEHIAKDFKREDSTLFKK